MWPLYLSCAELKLPELHTAGLLTATSAWCGGHAPPTMSPCPVMLPAMLVGWLCRAVDWLHSSGDGDEAQCGAGHDCPSASTTPLHMTI